MSQWHRRHAEMSRDLLDHLYTSENGAVVQEWLPEHHFERLKEMITASDRPTQAREYSSHSRTAYKSGNSLMWRCQRACFGNIVPEIDV